MLYKSSRYWTHPIPLSNVGHERLARERNVRLKEESAMTYDIICRYCMAIILLTAAILALSVQSHAATIFVPDDNETIAGGIEIAADGDTVMVKPGRYVENLIIEKNIVLGSRYLETGDTTFVAETIIDGNQKSSVIAVNPNATLDSCTVVFAGITLTNGSGWETDPFFGYSGGGIYSQSCDLTIRRCKIVGNHIEEGQNSGLYAYNSTVTITNTLFANNYSAVSYEANGCCTVSNGTVRLTDVVFNDNLASGSLRMYGTTVTADSVLIDGKKDTLGIYAYKSDILLTNSTICNCGRGAANMRDGSTLTLKRCIVRDNDSDDSIIYLCKDSTLHLLNTSVVNNNSDIGQSLYFRNSSAFLVNSIIWNSVTSGLTESIRITESQLIIDHCNIENSTESVMADNPDSLFWLEGNIAADPALDDSYIPGDASPCIDAGTVAFEWNGETLLTLAKDDYFGAAPDIGAFESRTTFVDNLRTRPIPHIFAPSPNPFNNATLLRFSLPSAHHVTVTVYNIGGQKVATLADSYMQAGIHWVAFNGAMLAAGTYFCRIETERYAETVKMSLIK